MNLNGVGISHRGEHSRMPPRWEGSMLHSKPTKLAILVAVCLLGVGVTHSAKAATTWIFDYTDGVQTYDVTETGVYDITAYGAQGGSSPTQNSYYRLWASGGLGAEIGGDITLNAGQTLTILVGGKGGDGPAYSSYNYYAGGGATYVVSDPGLPLLVAGGGGGAGSADAGYGGSYYYSSFIGAGPGGGYTGNSGDYAGEGGEGSGGGGGGGYGVDSGGGDGGLGGVASGDGGYYGFSSTGGGGYNGGIAAGGTFPLQGGAGAGSGGDGGAGGGSGGESGVGGGGAGFTGGTIGYGGSSFLGGSMTELVSIAGENTGNGYVTIESVGSRRYVRFR
jgi:hypothetical protein